MRQVESNCGASNKNKSSTEDEESDSCSQQSSSDTNKGKKVPQFSVSRSDSDGLRMKISAIRNTTENINSNNNNNGKKQSGKTESVNNCTTSNTRSSTTRTMKDEQKYSPKKRKKRKISTASSSSCCSKCSHSESEPSSEFKSNNGKMKKLKIKRKKVNLPADDKTCKDFSSDSESEMKNNDKKTNSAIAPKMNSNKSHVSSTSSSSAQALNTSTSSTKPVPSTKGNQSYPNDTVLQEGSSISSSDNEIPALVNAAIKCVESGSETENNSAEPRKQYTSTLLRDFMVKTQMLGSTSSVENRDTNEDGKCEIRQLSTPSLDLQPTTGSLNKSKRRGRPKKGTLTVQSTILLDSGNSNCSIAREKKIESTDSGIVSTAQSSSPSPNNHSKKTTGSGSNSNVEQLPHQQQLSSKSSPLVVSRSANNTPVPKDSPTRQKLSIASLDKRMYPTERVLYPPKGRKKNVSSKSGIGKSFKMVSSSGNKKEDSIDPIWKKIDVNTKFRRPSLSGYKSDGGTTVCSKILAARSGYVSDYCCSSGNRGYSGYRSDASGRSRYSVRSCVSRAKSCDSRCGSTYGGSNKAKKYRRRRRSIIKHSKSMGNVNEQDLLLLAGLSLGQSSDGSSHESLCKPGFSETSSKKFGEINRFVHTGEYFGRSKHNSVVEGDSFSSVHDKNSELINEIQSNNSAVGQSSSITGAGTGFNSVSYSNSNILGAVTFSGVESKTENVFRNRTSLYQFEGFSKKIRSRRSSVASRCSSTFSGYSKYDNGKKKRRRRSRYKYSRVGCVDSKLNTEIDILTNSFITLCIINNAEKLYSNKEKERSEKLSSQKNSNKRSTKKRKPSENVDHHSGGQSGTSGTVQKRRHKKTGQSNPDEHKLPLKKRHYLLTPGEKSIDGKSLQLKDLGEAKPLLGKHGANLTGKSSSCSSSSSKAITPKKRHLLESSSSSSGTESGTNSGKSNVHTGNDQKPSLKAIDNESEGSSRVNSVISSVNIRSDKDITKKRNRLEGLVSKIQSVNSPKDSGGVTVTTVTTSTISAGSLSSAGLSIGNARGQNVPPPGVFEPSVDLDIQIPATKICVSSVIMKSEIDSPNSTDFVEYEKSLSEPKYEKVVESLLNKTGGNLLLKRKRRKTINRTGFPTVRRKKRKIANDDNDSITSERKNNSISKSNVQEISCTEGKTAGKNNSSESFSEQRESECDRVPRMGEASDSFLERHNKQPRLSVVSLEKLQEPTVKKSNNIVENLERKLKSTHSVDGKNDSVVKKSEKDISSPIDEQLQEKDPLSVIPKRRGRPGRRSRQTEFKEKSEKSRSLSKISSRSISASVEKNDKKSTTTTVKQQTQKEKRSINKTKEKQEFKAADIHKNPDENQNVTSSIKVDKKHSEAVLSGSNEINETKKKATVKKDSTTSITINCPELSLAEILEQEPLPSSEGTNKVFAEELSEIIDAPAKTHSNASSTTNSNKRSSKTKKTYLTAGLLSDSFKVEKTKKSANGNESFKSPQKPLEITEISLNEHQSTLLPPPPYCEKFFRKTVRDFLLPYDIWWAYTNSKLPPRVSVPSWNYKKIRTNIYGDVRPNLAVDHQTCNCRPETACGDDCLNRMVYTECSPSNCPSGDKCLNQKIQKHDIAPGIERFMTENKGWGVRTSLPIRKGTYILEYVGEVVTEREFKERMATLYVNDTHHYCLHLDGGLVIDGHRMGSDGRFVNHSCLPNCEMQKWSVNGLSRMALFASRDIRGGEELTYDYNFSLFNPSEGQPCRCETPQCRGVIGGKSQRVKPLEKKAIENLPSSKSIRTRKRQAKKNSGRFQTKDVIVSQFQLPSDRERKIIKNKKCFLLRNLEKVRKLKAKLSTKSCENPSRPSTPSSIAAQITALRVPRNMVTRGLTLAAHDPEVEKIAKMAIIFREICQAVEDVKDNDGKPQVIKLQPAAKRKKHPSERNIKLIDFLTIQANIEKGVYKEPETFNEDMSRFLTNAMLYFGQNSEEAGMVIELSKVFQQKKIEIYSRLLELVPEKILKGFKNSGLNKQLVKTEDIIQCICGLFKDEGLMIQCSKCLVWQHTECTKANVSADNYLCEKCESREVDYEIPLDEYTEEGYRYYLSLLRGDLQIRQSDTVYVLRDIPIKDDQGNTLPSKKHTYETIGKIDFSECDIFRVERLWKDNEGRRFIFGHHYLRPHETFHEPTRKFYENEVVRVPLYEVVPIELVIARCWVLDRGTFCKGRPVDVTSEKHVYICELRVDKSARLFAKAKSAFPTCTKNYAFKRFKEPLKISKTYAPHEVDPSFIKPKKRKTEDTITSGNQYNNQHNNQQHNNSHHNSQQQQHQVSQNQQKKMTQTPIIQLLPPPAKTMNEKRNRLEDILTMLRKKQSALYAGKEIDLSYLLTGRGARQRKANAAHVPT